MRRFAGQDLAEDAAETEHVRSEVGALRPGLLGGHIQWRADELRLGLINRRRVSPAHDQDFATRSEHDIPGLDIAVDNAALVDVSHCLTHLLEDTEKLG